MGRVLALVAASLLLASCGSAQADLLAGAAVRTRDAGTSAVHWSAVSDDEEFAITGALDYERRTGELTFEVGGEFAGIAGMTIRFADDDKTYVRYPKSLASDELFADLADKWLRMPDFGGDMLGAESFLSALVPLPGLASPHDVLDVLGYAEGTVERREGVLVRGVETVHHRARLDVARLQRERSHGREPDEVTEFLREVDRLPLEAWIDDDGRARRIVLRFPAIGEEPPATVTVEFYDFGRVVDARKPSPDELLDLGELFGEQRQKKSH